MPQYTNFYESLKEARMRVENTVVLYDGEPYYVLAITDHKDDGIFRVYLDPIGKWEGDMYSRNHYVPSDWHDEPGMSKGAKLDEFLEQNKGCPIIRKMMNSPLFNKFRPFPLGMYHSVDGGLRYLERRPLRNTTQGLAINSVVPHSISMSFRKVGGLSDPRGFDFYSVRFAQTIIGQYPDAYTCYKSLTDPDVQNEGLAFSRDFAMLKGPVGFVFLVYKTEIVGIVEEGLCVKLSKEFTHLKELAQELNVFKHVSC